MVSALVGFFCAMILVVWWLDRGFGISVMIIVYFFTVIGRRMSSTSIFDRGIVSNVSFD